MSHVDDGRLAAYLDEPAEEGARGRERAGEVEAHLATCAECRARLELIRRERDKARAILRDAGVPAGRAPSFADVLKRSQTRAAQATDRKALSRLTSLAWAATIVVAVAVGWYARQLSLQPRIVPATPEAGMRISIDSPAVEARTPVTVAERAPRHPADRPKHTATPSPIATPAAPSQDRVDVAREVSGKLENAAPPASAALRDAEKQIATGSAAGAPLAKAVALAAWDEVSADEAALALGGKPLLIADAPVTSYALDAAGNHVRITQQIPDGTVIELVEGRLRAAVVRPEPAARSRAAMAPVAREADALTLKGAGPPDAVSTTQNGYSVTLRVVMTPRGALTRDSLAALLGRLR